MNFTQYKATCLLSPEDERDYNVSMLSCSKKQELPKSFELKYQFAIKDQGRVNSCVGHSVSEWFEVATKSSKEFSPGWIYGNRGESEYPGEGWYNKLAFDHAVKEGVCLLEDFPFNIEVPDVIKAATNNLQLYEKAAKNKAKSYVRLNGAEEIKRFIFENNVPVVVGIEVYENFYSTPKDGIVPAKSGELTGHHSVLITGWREDNRLIVLNSWSSNWGDNGYCYITDDIIREAWSATVEKITPAPTSKIYKVRLGGYSKEVAQDYVLKLNNLGIGAAIIPDGDKYAVQCGAYKSQENANAMKQKVADALISIVEIDK